MARGGMGVARRILRRKTPRQSANFSPFSPLTTMPSYPRACPRCGVMTAKAGFGVGRSKTGGRRSYCKACDRRRGRAYYDAHKDDLYAQREAAREAAWQAELEALAEGHRERIAVAKKVRPWPVARRSSCAQSGYPIGPRRKSWREPAVGLGRAKACQTAVDKDETLTTLDGAAKAQIVALCAVAE